VVDACLRVLDRPHVLGPINIGSGIETNVLQIHRTMSSYLSYDIVPEFRAASPGEPMRSCLDIGRAQALLGWTPQTTFVHGIARTLEWHLAAKASLVPVRT
jgi:UDP-glucose 4-epimerase